LRFGRGEGEARREHECTLRLATTRPRCGGLRWWFVCPLSERRCGKLHLPPGGDAFAARRAWRLGYHSQRVSPREREWRTASGRASRIRRRLGGPAGRVPAHADAPPRPKGMWNSTYERRRREIEEAERCAEAASWARVEAIVDPKRRRSPEAAPGTGQGRRRKGPASSEA